MHPSPLYRAAFLLLSLAVGLSALATAGAALLNPAGSAWFMFGFELCVVLACVFGVLTARGVYVSGVPMIWLCVAGCVAVASYVGMLSAGGRLFDTSLRPLVLGRLGAAGLFVLAACFEATRLNARAAWPMLIKGTACLLPVAGVLAAWRFGLLAKVEGFLAIVVFGVAFVLIGGFLAAGFHWLIRGFEVGLKARTEPPKTA